LLSSPITASHLGVLCVFARATLFRIVSPATHLK
jgi:hypothetical protein